MNEKNVGYEMERQQIHDLKSENKMLRKELLSKK